MASVGGRSHGGDAGGEPPRGPNRIQNRCEGSVVRGITKNKEFRKAIKRNKNRPLALEFDDKDQKTFKAVGDNQHHFYNYIGELLSNFPFDYDKWAKVPEVHKTVLIPSLEGFFDLRRHLNDLTVITVRNKLHTVGSLVQAGLKCSFKDQWKDRKNKLKEKGFSKYESVQKARESTPPPEWKRSAEEWQKQIDFWADPKRMAIAKKNAQNRAKKKTTSHQGSKSFAQGRHEFNQMIAMQKQVADRLIAPLTSDEIMNRVLESNDRGHIPGRGRIVTGTGSSHPPLPEVDYMSQAAWNAEREVLIRKAQESKKLAKRARNEAKEARNSCKEFVTQFTAYFNQQAGNTSNFTPFNFRPNSFAPNSSTPSSSTPSSTTPSSSTHPHNALAEFNSDPNLYQNIMNPDGCYKPVRDDEDAYENDEADSDGDGDADEDDEADSEEE